MIDSRIDLLIEISKLLSQFETVEQVVPAVLDCITQAIPMHTAVLIGEVESHSILRAWRAGDQTTAQLDEALEHARASFGAYFGDEAPFARRLQAARATVGTRVLPLGRVQASRRTAGRFIILPLVRAQHGIFGALQIEPAGLVGEEELAFLNTVVNLLAIALDRHIASQRETAEQQDLLMAVGRASHSSYLGFPCTNCKQPVIALPIPHGMATPTMSKGRMHLQCAHCAWKEDYAAKDMRRYEVEQITG
jgi:GAF domain-containing protein